MQVNYINGAIKWFREKRGRFPVFFKYNVQTVWFLNTLCILLVIKKIFHIKLCDLVNSNNWSKKIDFAFVLYKKAY